MLKQITAPAAEPVSLAEAKLHARIDGTEDDDLVLALIAAARREAEQLRNAAIITQTWEQVLPALADSMSLDIGPVQSVTSIKYLDGAGAEQTLDPSVYGLLAEATPPAVYLKTGQGWPATYAQADAVRIRFVAGFGAAGTDVPAEVRAWIRMRVSSLYAQREEFISGTSVAEMPNRFLDRLLDGIGHTAI